MNDTYTLDEMKYWLTNKEQKAVDWRTDPENNNQLGIMISQFAKTPGGMAVSTVMSQITQEQRAKKIEQQRAKEIGANASALKEAARANYINAGGSPNVFESRWPAIRDGLLESGDAGRMIEEANHLRRSKAARTF